MEAVSNVNCSADDVTSACLCRCRQRGGRVYFVRTRQAGSCFGHVVRHTARRGCVAQAWFHGEAGWPRQDSKLGARRNATDARSDARATQPHSNSDRRKATCDGSAHAWAAHDVATFAHAHEPQAKWHSFKNATATKQKPERLELTFVICYYCSIAIHEAFSWCPVLSTLNCAVHIRIYR